MSDGPLERMTRKGYTYVRLPCEGNGYDILLIDQRIQGGQACIRGTRIPARSIYGMWKTGDSIEYLCRSFNISESKIKACIEYIEGKSWEEIANGGEYEEAL